ncbi:hypothetical protein QTN25_008834 [Entamoeba marina]
MNHHSSLISSISVDDHLLRSSFGLNPSPSNGFVDTSHGTTNATDKINIQQSFDKPTIHVNHSEVSNVGGEIVKMRNTDNTTEHNDTNSIQTEQKYIDEEISYVLRKYNIQNHIIEEGKDIKRNEEISKRIDHIIASNSLTKDQFKNSYVETTHKMTNSKEQPQSIEQNMINSLLLTFQTTKNENIKKTTSHFDIPTYQDIEKTKPKINVTKSRQSTKKTNSEKPSKHHQNTVDDDQLKRSSEFVGDNPPKKKRIEPVIVQEDTIKMTGDNLLNNNNEGEIIDKEKGEEEFDLDNIQKLDSRMFVCNFEIPSNHRYDVDNEFKQWLEEMFLDEFGGDWKTEFQNQQDHSVDNEENDDLSGVEESESSSKEEDVLSGDEDIELVKNKAEKRKDRRQNQYTSVIGKLQRKLFSDTAIKKGFGYDLEDKFIDDSNIEKIPKLKTNPEMKSISVSESKQHKTKGNK